jgi:hypothetical protein
VRRPLPHGRLILAVLIVIAAAIAIAYAWTWIPPSAETKAAVLKTVVGYELAPAPVWPEAYQRAGRLSPEARDVLQAGYEARLGSYATAGVLRRWQRLRFARELLLNRASNGGRICIAGAGTVVYYDFRSRRPNGDLLVRSGVQHRFAAGRWDPRAQAMTAVVTDVSQIVVIMDYTLTKVGGVWKVANVHGWRFLDMADGRITYDPPGSTSPAPASPAP